MSPKSSNPLVCIYTNKDKNEFAIGLKEDESFRAITKVDDSYTRFVDVSESTRAKSSLSDYLDDEETMKQETGFESSLSDSEIKNYLEILVELQKSRGEKSYSGK